MTTGWDRYDEVTALLDRANAGDEAAFVDLYREVAPLARRAARRIVRDGHAVDDLVQETFYLVLNAVRSGHGPRESFHGYVLATVRRLAYRHSGQQKRTVAIHDPVVWDRLLGRTPAADADGDRIAAAWAGLPARWRQVLWLVDVEDYAPAELAPRMAMTPNAVSSLATRARRALRAAYLAAADA
ncbi:RNA polymerase sigma factor [Jiangella asiatica]|uniref:Sigma-70 family RNA polymerase sigma factor n=1 Tax=Jiangella asiatica TaxID=2530372 RepID=A0A4R5CQ07_9ACTN|nr:sigma-70 family RNA polymerase sigma factor [Jiangella asiatica]TDE02562.1 sigma-70 family RNA polymerase sigma factor [Jiangella asiatica]